MLSRSDRHWQILISEYKDCKQKLKSKKEAQKIMQKMLTSSEMEVKKLEQHLKSLATAADELVSKAKHVPNLEKFNVPREGLDPEKTSLIQGLILLVNKLQREVQCKEKAISSCQTQNSDLIKDLKALRSDMTGFNRVVAPSLDPEQSREDFLVMIQSLKKEVDIANMKIKTLKDEATDFRIEREFYKQKVHSLTEQLLEKSSCQPIADIEKLLEDNRLLRDKVDKLQHINAALVTHHTSSPRIPPPCSSSKRATKSYHVTFEDEQSLGFMRSVKEKVKVETELQHLQVLIEDMQKVSNGLAETVLDKTTALKHQRASNRLLGDRVTELEAKLRALEMSGFWNVPEGFAEEEESQRQVLQRLTVVPDNTLLNQQPPETCPEELLVDPCYELPASVTRHQETSTSTPNSVSGNTASNSRQLENITSLFESRSYAGSKCLLNSEPSINCDNFDGDLHENDAKGVHLHGNDVEGYDLHGNDAEVPVSHFVDELTSLLADDKDPNLVHDDSDDSVHVPQCDIESMVDLLPVKEILDI